MHPIVLVPITVLFLAGLFLGRNELVKRRLICPLKGDTATVDVLRRSLRPSHLVRVKRCSLLAQPKRIDCDQACLRAQAAQH